MTDPYDPPLNPALALRNRYVLALSLIAFLIISSQIGIQLTIGRNDDDSRVVNIAGRQRMLSQKMAKAALEIVIARDAMERTAPAAELATAAELWRVSHDGLLEGSAELGLHGRNSEAVLRIFRRIEPAYLEMLATATKLGERARDPRASGPELGFTAAPILRREKEFLTGMNEITFLYDRETKERLGFVRLLEYALLAITCFTLALEALFIFLPAERQINRYFREMKRAVTILKEKAAFDEMTGIYNKATGLLILDRELEKARRMKSPLALCFVDLDGLKLVNDSLGHDSGDALIKAFATILRGIVRSEDAAFRYGGDEFILILACDRSHAETVIERVRRSTDAANAEPGRAWRLGFSSGIAVWEPGSRTGAAELICEADAEMYREKEAHKASGNSARRA